MAKIFLVRHGTPVVSHEVPARDWPLSDAGRDAVTGLASQHDWPLVSGIYHSLEPKAKDTAKVLAQHLSAPLVAWPMLGEIPFETPIFYDPETFESFVRDFLQRGIQGPFQETYHEAESRIVHALHSIVGQDGPGLPIAVSHGRILAVLWSYLLGTRLSVRQWREIPMPGLALVDLAGPSVIQPWTPPR